MNARHIQLVQDGTSVSAPRLSGKASSAGVPYLSETEIEAANLRTLNGIMQNEMERVKVDLALWKLVAVCSFLLWVMQVWIGRNPL